MESLIRLLSAAGITAETDAGRVNSYVARDANGNDRDGPSAYLATHGTFVFLSRPTSLGIGRVGEWEQVEMICIAPTLAESMQLADRAQGAVIRPTSPWQLVSKFSQANDLGSETHLTVRQIRTSFR